MNPFDKVVDIAAPPSRVWQVMSDIERWPEWTASVSRVTVLGKKPLAVGSRLWIKQPKFPPAMWKILAIDPDRGFTSTSGSPGLRVVAHHTIVPTSDGSRVTLALEYHGIFGKWLARLTEDITRRYLDLEAAGLKARSEAVAAHPR